MTTENITQMKEKINTLGEELESLKDVVKMSKNSKNIRLKSDINGKSNVPTRISRNLRNELIDIFKKREEKIKKGENLGKIEIPKATDLIIEHYHWATIKEDIVNYKNEK